MNQIVVNEPNRWRLETPGADWPRMILVLMVSISMA